MLVSFRKLGAFASAAFAISALLATSAAATPGDPCVLQADCDQGELCVTPTDKCTGPGTCAKIPTSLLGPGPYIGCNGDTYTSWSQAASKLVNAYPAQKYNPFLGDWYSNFPFSANGPYASPSPDVPYEVPSTVHTLTAQSIVAAVAGDHPDTNWIVTRFDPAVAPLLVSTVRFWKLHKIFTSPGCDAAHTLEMKVIASPKAVPPKDLSPYPTFITPADPLPNELHPFDAEYQRVDYGLPQGQWVTLDPGDYLYVALRLVGNYDDEPNGPYTCLVTEKQGQSPGQRTWWSHGDPATHNWATLKSYGVAEDLLLDVYAFEL